MRTSLLLAPLALYSAAASTSFYVDCAHGSDSNTGTTPSSPFATLARAQTSVRAAQPAAPPGITVYIQGDCISRDATGVFSNASLLTLTAADSGASPDAPTTWTSWIGGAPARLLGGLIIPSSAWSPASASAPVAAGTVVADLSEAGLDVARFGFGALGAGGLGSCADTAMELFVDGAAQVLARYPNIVDGVWQWIEIDKVEDSMTEYTIDGAAAARALTWPTASSPGASAWVHGYWSFDWADSYCEVKNVTRDGQNATLRIEPQTNPVYGFLPKARFYGVNILSELDAANEYFIDVDAQLIYWMPPSGGVAATKEVVLSISETIVSTAPGATVSNIVLDSISFLYARGVGLALTAENVTVSGCSSSLHGQNGINLDGSNLVLRDSLSYGTGCHATSISGGDFKTLTRSNNLLLNNTVHSFARITRTYQPGIAFGDVGASFINNSISNGPHTGLTGGGAFCLFEGNTFDSLLYESSDAGAFYVGRSWTNRGNVIRNNTFRNIHATEQTFLGYPSVQAIYLDDEQSGYTIENNVCEDSHTCYFVGGGRDIIVRNNICRNVGTCLHMDNRGMNWQVDACTYNKTYTGDLVQGLFNMNYKAPPYSTAFPEIVDTLSNRPCVPVNVSFLSNAACNATTLIDTSLTDLASWGDVFEGNTNASTCA